MCLRTITPPIGTVPEVTPLAKVIMSGTTPKACAANASPTRPNAVITSSKMRRMPCLRVISRSFCR